MRNKLIELVFANKVLKIEYEDESLLVRYCGKCVVGVFSLQVNDKFGELVVFAKAFDGIC